VKPFGARAGASFDDRFDVAISFAGTERDCAAELADQIKRAGFSVFYDDFYPEFLWGKNLAIEVDETELARMPPTIGYVPLSAGIERIEGLLIKNLKA
jgi:hypothetical protein